jgi:GH15 family glucan-1,4-alpha-glucosidase
MPLMQAGYVEEAQAWRDWLRRTLAGQPDKMQIMYGLGGERDLTEWEAHWLPGYQDSRPVRIGNAAHDQLQIDVYGEVLEALHRLHGMEHAPEGWEVERGLVEHLETVWEQPDEGMWEVRGGRQRFTFSAIMAWVAFDRAIHTAERWNLEAPLDRWRALRARVHDEVCREGYDADRNSFVQYFGSTSADASLLLIPTTGFLPADDPRVRGTVAAVERELFQSGIVRRYDTRTGVDGLPPGESAFFPCNFWLVDAYAMQGRMSEANALFERMLALRNDLGLLSEEYEPVLRRQMGNFPQGFCHLTLINSAFRLAESAPPET